MLIIHQDNSFIKKGYLNYLLSLAGFETPESYKKIFFFYLFIYFFIVMQEKAKYDILSLNVRGIRDQAKRRSIFLFKFPVNK